jgi:hypothetical protein
MSMHLVRGMSSLNTQKRKAKNQSKRFQRIKEDHEKFLERMGVKGDTSKNKTRAVYDIPDYSTGPRVTSDSIPGNGTKKDSMKYTGDEIMGYVTMHKSNTVPIRKDNKKAAVDAAQMRRS